MKPLGLGIRVMEKIYDEVFMEETLRYLYFVFFSVVSGFPALFSYPDMLNLGDFQHLSEGMSADRADSLR